MTDFYQSPADKLRFEILLKSLREGSLNLAIIGEDEVALANYGRQIYDHLIEIGETNVEWWNSADSEKLVQRFNDILSELTVDEALDKTQKRSAKRYMIFPDTNAIQDFELQLLARLINGFPTSNINLVLVVNQNDPYQDKLSVFGKNLLQWILESENPQDSSSAPRGKRNSNRIETIEESPNASADAIADFSATFAATIASGKFPSPVGNLSNHEVSQDSQNSYDPVLDFSPNPNGRRPEGSDEATEAKSSLSTKVAGILIIAIIATVVAVAAIYQDEVLKQAQSLEDFVSGKKPASAKSDKVQKPTGTGEGSPVVQVGADKLSVDQKNNAENGVPTGVVGAAVNPAINPASNPASNPTPNSVPNSAAPANPSSVGMSSSTKVPVKADDSLIPNKEVILTPPTTVAQNTVNNPVKTTADTKPTNAVNLDSKPQNRPEGKVETKIEAKPENKTDTKPDTKLQAKPEFKSESKTDVKTDLKADAKSDSKLDQKASLKSDSKPLPREEGKQVPSAQGIQTAQTAGTPAVPAKTTNPAPSQTKPKEVNEARDAKESKPQSTKPTPSARESETLPKLAPKPEKTEESKPKSSSESASGFKPRPEDQRWVQQLPEDGWVMQHAALDTAEEASSFQQSSPFYRDARIMYTKRRDAAPYYIVVTGPYSSRQEADAEVRKHPIMSKSWIRSAKSLKNQFED